MSVEHITLTFFVVLGHWINFEVLNDFPGKIFRAEVKHGETKRGWGEERGENGMLWICGALRYSEETRIKTA